MSYGTISDVTGDDHLAGFAVGGFSGILTERPQRFINRVRYFAMMEGSFRPAPRWWERFAGLFHHREKPPVAALAERTDESLLVALATIHEKHSEWFAGDFSDFQIVLGQLPEAGSSLSALDAATYEHFKKLVAGVEVR